MTDAIVATVEPHALALVVPESKMKILGDVIAPGLSPAQLEVFAVACNRTRLDPFAKQIYAISRWDGELGRNKITIQTGIDGIRIIAERTGKYGGRLPFEWCGPDGVWVDVWLKKEAPAAARARIVRTDWPQPIVAVARYSAYVQTKKGTDTPTHMWKRMDAEQLAKCAEALGLRTAFPQELSGLYSDEEMAQSDDPEPSGKPEPKAAPKEERKSPLPPPAAAGPCFAESWPDKAWAGKPLRGAPGNVLSDYAAWVQSIIDDPTRTRLHKKAQQSMAEVEAELQRLLDDEADRAMAASAGPAQPDPVAVKLQQQIDARGREPGEDETMPDGWGLSGEAATP